MGWLRKKSLPVVLSVNKGNHAIGTSSYQKLATNLLLKKVEQSCQTVLITSANPGEGKSTTAINIALMLNKMGKRVVLVEANLERPILDQVLEFSDKNALTDSPVKTSVAEPAIQSTAEGLKVIIGDTLSTNDSTLSRTGDIKSLVDFLKSKAEYIILDSSALVNSGDPLILAAWVDWVVLVVRGKVTTKQDGQQAVALLREAGANFLGVVLNDFNQYTNGYHVK